MQPSSHPAERSDSAASICTSSEGQRCQSANIVYTPNSVLDARYMTTCQAPSKGGDCSLTMSMSNQISAFMPGAESPLSLGKLIGWTAPATNTRREADRHVPQSYLQVLIIFRQVLRAAAKLQVELTYMALDPQTSEPFTLLWFYPCIRDTRGSAADYPRCSRSRGHLS